MTTVSWLRTRVVVRWVHDRENSQASLGLSADSKSVPEASHDRCQRYERRSLLAAGPVGTKQQQPTTGSWYHWDSMSQMHLHTYTGITVLFNDWKPTDVGTMAGLCCMGAAMAFAGEAFSAVLERGTHRPGSPLAPEQASLLAARRASMATLSNTCRVSPEARLRCHHHCMSIA